MDLGTSFLKNILVIFSGKLTRGQKEKAEEKMLIHTDKVITALEWLCENNWEWRSFKLNKLQNDLQ